MLLIPLLVVVILYTQTTTLPDITTSNTTTTNTSTTAVTDTTTDRNNITTILPLPKDTSPTTIQEGDIVEGNYHGCGTWHAAVVDRVRADGTFDLDYDNGDREVRMPAEFVRWPVLSHSIHNNSSNGINLPTTTPTTPTTTIKDNYFANTTTTSNQNIHTYVPNTTTSSSNTIYTDEYSTTPVRASATYTLSPMHRPEQPHSSFNSPIKAGRIYTPHSPTPTITNTANFAKNVSFSIPTITKPSVKITVFDTEANYRNKGIWLPVTAITDRMDGLYDVYYEDGDFEEAVLPVRIYPDPMNIINSLENMHNINSSNSTSSSTAANSASVVLKWYVGQNIQVNYHNKHFWLAATVTSVYSDNSVDVVYGDGEVECRVPCIQLRAVEIEGSGGSSNNAGSSSNAVSGSSSSNTDEHPQPSPPREHRTERPHNSSGSSSSNTASTHHHHRHHRHHHHHRDHNKEHSESSQQKKK